MLRACRPLCLTLRCCCRWQRTEVVSKGGPSSSAAPPPLRPAPPPAAQITCVQTMAAVRSVADVQALAGLDFLIAPVSVLERLNEIPTMSGYNDGIVSGRSGSTEEEETAPIQARAAKMRMMAGGGGGGEGGKKNDGPDGQKKVRCGGLPVPAVVALARTTTAAPLKRRNGTRSACVRYAVCRRPAAAAVRLQNSRVCCRRSGCR